MAAQKGNKTAQKGNEPMTSYIHCRIAPGMKAKFVKQAQSENLKFCEWILRKLNDNN